MTAVPDVLDPRLQTFVDLVITCIKREDGTYYSADETAFVAENGTPFNYVGPEMRVMIHITPSGASAVALVEPLEAGAPAIHGELDLTLFGQKFGL